jgi:hypothetical protein
MRRKIQSILLLLFWCVFCCQPGASLAANRITVDANNLNWFSPLGGKILHTYCYTAQDGSQSLAWTKASQLKIGILMNLVPKPKNKIKKLGRRIRFLRQHSSASSKQIVKLKRKRRDLRRGSRRCSATAPDSDYDFDGSISEIVLKNYLARAITMSDMFMGIGDVDDHIRMLTNIGAKFAGRTTLIWGDESALSGRLDALSWGASKAHAADPELILQAAIFEIITTDVNNVPVPGYVFEEFNLQQTSRNFDYESMILQTAGNKDFYGPGRSVPGVSQLETRMWFFYLASAYIDRGIEAIHMGQLEWMSEDDTSKAQTESLLTRIRNYAKKNARRHYVLLDAHSHGMTREGRLLLDFHSYPLRPIEDSSETLGGKLQAGFQDAIYGKSKGGIAPSGWSTTSQPYLVEFDHGYCKGGREENVGFPFIWGYDEMTWFSVLAEQRRNDFLQYACNWIKDNDSVGSLQMPGLRQIFVGFPQGVSYYYAHQASIKSPEGFNQEGTIKELWGADCASPASARSFQED